MDLFFLAYVFVLGVTIGSFLNVLIDRIPRNESIIKTRSHCEHCRRTLEWNDLIPIVSFLMLKGRCRYCKKHIGYYYPFVETLTGLLFVFTAVFASDGSIPLMLYYLFLISCLIVICFTDFKYGIIPFKIVLAAGIAALAYTISSGVFLNHLFSGLVVSGFFLLLFLATRGRGLGFGDVVYALLMGIILGFPKIIVGLYIAFLTGAIVSLILVWTGKKKLKGGSIPFGPFLVTGTLMALFWGEFFIQKALSYLVG